MWCMIDDGDTAMDHECSRRSGSEQERRSQIDIEQDIQLLYRAFLRAHGCPKRALTILTRERWMEIRSGAEQH